MRLSSAVTTVTLALFAVSCSSSSGGSSAAGDSAGGSESSGSASAASQEITLPPDAGAAVSALNNSPRHGEWDMIPVAGGDSVRAWVVYPQRSDKAPVVVVVHEIFGLTHWVRSVADHLASEGFIAVAPDLLTGTTIPQDSVGDPQRDSAVSAIRSLDPNQVDRRLKATATWATALPSATGKYGIVGFCWGGSTVFAQATRDPNLSATAVYYGTTPDPDALSNVQSPVIAFYGGADNRVTSTEPVADSVMGKLGKTFDPHIFDGAGHGFLRQQDGQDGANMKATQQAWPLTVQWFRKYLES